MTHRCLFPATLALLITVAACTGYRDLKKEMQAYKPPSYAGVQEQPRAARSRPTVDTGFVAAQKRLEEAKAHWEKSLTAPAEDTLFHRPAPAIQESLRPAGSDDDRTADALQNGFSLETLETLTLLRNPGIQAAENRFRGALETFSQVAALDEILRQYTAFTEALMTGIGPMKGQDPVQMKFPFPGVLSLKGEIAGQEARAAREELELARREAVTAGRKTYWNLLFVRRALKISGDTVELFRDLESVANTRYESGKTSFQDVIKVRIEREILEEELITLQEKQRNLESKIREILNLPPVIELGSPASRKPRTDVPLLADLYPRARERRQELRRTRALVGKMARMIELAETMILPSYTLNLSLYADEAVNQVGSMARQATFPVATTASQGAGLPQMPWYGTSDAFLRQTRQKLKALQEDLLRSEAETATLVRDSWFELDQARREEALYRQTVVKLSQAALEVSTRGYETGKVAFADVIASYTAWLRANLTLERKKSDLGIAWAELERSVGTSWH
ncbi:MAG: TolC family protein [Desulfobacterales bacterium]|nr:MAG: TolC family protein [Desulfobacterales bacterium]